MSLFGLDYGQLSDEEEKMEQEEHSAGGMKRAREEQGSILVGDAVLKQNSPKKPRLESPTGPPPSSVRCVSLPSSTRCSMFGGIAIEFFLQTPLFLSSELTPPGACR